MLDALATTPGAADVLGKIFRPHGQEEKETWPWSEEQAQHVDRTETFKTLKGIFAANVRLEAIFPGIAQR